MYIQEDISLSNYSTMRLGGKAKYLCVINQPNQLAEAHFWAEKQNLPLKMIGGGSNIFWDDNGYDGLVVVNNIFGLEVVNQTPPNTYIKVGAGENWDKVVEYSVNLNLSGIEFLSLIPGLAGATPIQNVGAYGQEIANVLTTVEAFDRSTGQMIVLRGSDCQFGYRSSRFKLADKDRFLIAYITLNLSQKFPQPPFYASLDEYLKSLNIDKPSPLQIRQAVIALRNLKLPDPTIVANNGSFFKNPIVSPELFEELKQKWQQIVNWQQADGSYKLSAAWLIEQAGFKDYHDQQTGFGTWPAQPLVIINEKATKTQQLIEFRDKINAAVIAKFGIKLEQEPEYIRAA